MIILIAKILLILVPHIAIAIVWQKRTHAAWSGLLFALVAFSIHFLVRIPLDRLLPLLFEPIVGRLVFWQGLWPSWIIQWLLFGLLREGVRWLTFRHVATSVQSWRDGVMFGIGYSSFATLILLGEHIPTHIPNSTPPPPTLIGAAMMVNDSFKWTNTLQVAWQWGVILMTFNVATSLAVLFSVQRRQVWLLLTAVMLFVIYAAAPRVVLLYYADVQVGGLDPQGSLMLLFNLANVIAVLPPLWLIFRLRKPLDKSDFK